MHAMDIIINTFIVLSAIQVWAIVGYVIVSFIDEFETAESHLLTCLFWPLIILNWIDIKLNNYIESNQKPEK